MESRSFRTRHFVVWFVCLIVRGRRRSCLHRELAARTAAGIARLVRRGHASHSMTVPACARGRSTTAVGGDAACSGGAGRLRHDAGGSAGLVSGLAHGAGGGNRAVSAVTGGAQQTTGGGTGTFTYQGRHGSLGCPWPNGAQASRGRGRVCFEPDPTPAPWRSVPSPVGGTVPLPETTPRWRDRIPDGRGRSYRWAGTFVRGLPSALPRSRGACSPLTHRTQALARSRRGVLGCATTPARQRRHAVGCQGANRWAQDLPNGAPCEPWPGSP
jgi:hypothetical protein